MPKKTREEAIRDQLARRAKANKPDYVFLDPEERRARVVKTMKGCEYFLAKYLTLLDAAHKKGEIVGVSLDVECDYVIPGSKPYRKADPHYWVRNLFPTVSRAKLNTRREENKKIEKAFSKMAEAAIDDDEEIKSIYWCKLHARQTTGLLKCDLHSIQLACTNDKDGDMVFMIHASELIRGKPEQNGNPFSTGFSGPGSEGEETIEKCQQGFEWRATETRRPWPSTTSNVFRLFRTLAVRQRFR